MTVGSLFSGVGAMDLGLEHAGMTVYWQCEIDKRCRDVLARHWPNTECFYDVRDLVHGAPAVDLLCGGDPCPVRSRAAGNRRSKHPDLSGYFLAVAARLRPRWLVRENVPAPDALDFATALAALGYGVVVVALDARDFTGQSRRRQFCIGCPAALRGDFHRAVLDAAIGVGFTPTRCGETTPVAACLTAHGTRLAAEDSYCYEPGRGLRFLDPREREALQGLPRDWTAGFSYTRRSIMCGNAVCVPVAEWIGRRILEVANGEP